MEVKVGARVDAAGEAQAHRGYSRDGGDSGGVDAMGAPVVSENSMPVVVLRDRQVQAAVGSCITSRVRHAMRKSSGGWRRKRIVNLDVATSGLFPFSIRSRKFS